MATKLITSIALLFFAAPAINAQATQKFMGRKITITKAKTDADGFVPLGPASVCLEGPPQRQCYVAPKDYGRAPTVSIVQIKKEMPAMLFSAISGGVSGVVVHFALLRPGASKDLENLFLDNMEVSNQSQNAFWGDPSISDAAIFVTADFVWGPGEAHYAQHRYIISSYTRRHLRVLDDNGYYLEDQYMTAGKFEIEKTNILAAEKQEILARLKRLKSQDAPH